MRITKRSFSLCRRKGGSKTREIQIFDAVFALAEPYHRLAMFNPIDTEKIKFTNDELTFYILMYYDLLRRIYANYFEKSILGYTFVA